MTSYELLDKSFAWPTVRRYNIVKENLETLEHFEDNLNTNISNLQNVKNFIHYGQSVQSTLNDMYHDGEFTDPATVDPVKVIDVDWAGTPVWECVSIYLSL